MNSSHLGDAFASCWMCMSSLQDELPIQVQPVIYVMS